jgi:hypothetical protein
VVCILKKEIPYIDFSITEVTWFFLAEGGSVPFVGLNLTKKAARCFLKKEHRVKGERFLAGLKGAAHLLSYFNFKIIAVYLILSEPQIKSD